MNKRLLRLAAIPVAFSLVAAACGDDDDDTGGDDTETTDAGGDDGGDDGGDAGGDQDFGGASITITGPERTDEEAGAIQDVMDAFGEQVNLNITYSGDADWEANINTQVEAGNPPDISFFPQPGKLADFARDGFIVALPDDVDATIDEFWADDFQIYGNVDGTQYGVPAKTDLKSLVWYVPSRFEEAGYEVPETFDEFTALVDQIAADGEAAALCVGIESGQATGWTFTDWTEEMVLRQHGGDVYDQWVTNEIPFDDPQIVESMQTVVDLWAPENVFASGGSIAATSFQDNAVPLLDGNCFMHRQASFFASFFPEGTPFATDEEGAVDVFYFPDINGDRPVLTAGTLAAAFNDSPETMAVMNYIATADYAEARQAAQAARLGGSLSGFLSAAQGQDPSVYQPLEQGFLDIVTGSELSRFDASDLMPADVGSGTFWSEGTSLVNGDIDAQTAATRIQESWPS
ncbi:MAG TPA: ABC transporter substrate-binding protein [Ilumatobacteraceae bacterium]|nr:ABC transporter substrate-binding protein [Ilumatobacteraceae bacterium]